MSDLICLIAAVQARGAFSRYRGGIFAGCDPNVRSVTLSLRRFITAFPRLNWCKLVMFHSYLVIMSLSYIILPFFYSQLMSIIIEEQILKT